MRIRWAIHGAIGSYHTRKFQLTATVLVTVLDITSLEVTPSEITIDEGNMQQLTVIAHYSDGTTAEITAQASYSSSNTDIATVNESGNISVLAAGNTVITVSYEGRSVDVPVTVNAILESISVSPDELNLATGKTAQLKVTAHMSDGSTEDVTALASYRSDNEAVVTVSDSGLLDGKSQGSATITVQYEGQSATVQVTVTEPVVESITAEPSSITLSAGNNQQVTVTAHLSDGSTKDVTTLASYSSDNSNASVAGTGLVTGVIAGSATITIQYGGYTVNVPVQITAPVVESIIVDPATVTLEEGGTQQLTVKACYSDGSTRNVTGEAAYSTSNSGVASVSSTGLVEGNSQGSATIFVSYEGKTAIAQITVLSPPVLVERI
ncbi:Ig-like domain-containing protein [Desulfallas sp. Bu1-1]|nr:Ig-like domain-containing protein [Desulfallas sp. Bu1-1]